MTFHRDVMPASQRALLHRLGPVATRHDFYLGGGTAVAIHIGHRRSVDLDWFTSDAVADPLRLAETLRGSGIDSLTLSVDEGTLHTQLEGIRTSFLEYRYPMLQSLVDWPEFGCRLASLRDLACMKLSAIAGRGSKKDFIDVYALGRTGFDVAGMADSYQQKFQTEDIGHVVMSLTYFDDADEEDMPEMIWDVGWEEVKETIEGWITDYARRRSPIGGGG